MRPVLDSRSLLIGAFAGVASVAVFGAAQDDRSGVGRYQVTAAANGSTRWVYVIDTETGRIWERIANGDFDRIASPWEK